MFLMFCLNFIFQMQPVELTAGTITVTAIHTENNVCMDASPGGPAMTAHDHAALTTV